MPTSVISAIIYIVNAFTSLYLLILLLRFWLPIVRADFRNPLTQGIFRLTSPLITPLRRLLHPIGKIDTASIFISLVFQYLTLLLLLYVSDRSFNSLQIFLSSIIRLIMLSINIFTFAIFIQVLMSWLSPPGYYNPITSIVISLSTPILRQLKRVIAILSGMDLTPVFAIIFLIAMKILISGLLPIGIII